MGHGELVTGYWLFVISSQQSTANNSQFPIPNSQFPIPHSQFPIPHSQLIKSTLEFF